MEKEFPAEFAQDRRQPVPGRGQHLGDQLVLPLLRPAHRPCRHADRAKVRYVDTTMRAGLNYLPKLLAKRNMDFFCLNDGSFPEVEANERADLVTDFLEKYFPVKAPWEK